MEVIIQELRPVEVIPLELRRPGAVIQLLHLRAVHVIRTVRAVALRTIPVVVRVEAAETRVIQAVAEAAVLVVRVAVRVVATEDNQLHFTDSHPYLD